MQFAFFTMGVLALWKGVIAIFQSIQFKKSMAAAAVEHPSAYSPPTTVIVPCKGVEPGFADNVCSILSQSYDAYEIIFVTEASQDPAYSVLNNLLNRDGRPITKLIVAGPTQNSAQKLHNLRAGLKQVSKDTEVLVFADSDIHADQNWLRHLTAPLQNPAIGAATGYRWYLPARGNLGSALRSVWNMTSANLLFSDAYNFAWGGSMAIRKQLFEKLQIEKRWRAGLSDDMILTNAVKAAGYKIQFVPRCLVTSGGKISLRALVGWIARQMTMIRIYDPKLWRLAAFPNWIFSLIFLLGSTLIVRGIFSAQSIPVAAWMMIADVLFGGVINWIRFSAFKQSMPDLRDNMGNQSWPYFTLHVPASFVMAVGLIMSWRMRRITWRGINYEISPFQLAHKELAANHS